ncbi:uncharacterized protein LOC142623459 [Castanea sativa]|uniref:uncharacterized protein LOC142623459 n=1 Tax=Castanea sativa TaxID=21020 RepID=UPI003F64E054
MYISSSFFSVSLYSSIYICYSILSVSTGSLFFVPTPALFMVFALLLTCQREDAAQLHQFILHDALDIVQDLAWTTSAMFLKAIDRFNDLVVSVYVTAGHNPCGCFIDGINFVFLS